MLKRAFAVLALVGATGAGVCDSAVAQGRVSGVIEARAAVLRVEATRQGLEASRTLLGIWRLGLPAQRVERPLATVTWDPRRFEPATTKAVLSIHFLRN